MHECPKTHFKHKCMHSSHHANSSCHVTMPHHHAMSSCHIIMPCQHDTSSCHVIIPHQHAMSSCHMSPCDWSVLYGYHVSSSDWYHIIMFVQYGCHVSPCQWCHVAPLFAKFACWPYRTERDNFLIRSPFEVKRTSLESSRWALLSSASFAEIGGLQKFSFLDPPGSFLPTEKILASKSLY